MEQTEQTAIKITINGNEETDGVDTPWFSWKHGSGATVQWVNSTPHPCQITFFQGQSPISVNALHLAAGEPSAVYPLSGPPPPDRNWPLGKVYKLYKYKVELPGHTPSSIFDPGGGPRP